MKWANYLYDNCENVFISLSIQYNNKSDKILQLELENNGVYIILFLSCTDKKFVFNRYTLR